MKTTTNISQDEKTEDKYIMPDEMKTKEEYVKILTDELKKMIPQKRKTLIHRARNLRI